MSFTIEFNHNLYLVTDHTAKRMQQRDVTDAMIVDTMERGDWIEQPHGREMYERDVVIGGEVCLLQVVVDPDEMAIISVLVYPE